MAREKHTEIDMQTFKSAPASRSGICPPAKPQWAQARTAALPHKLLTRTPSLMALKGPRLATAHGAWMVLLATGLVVLE
jgi:hypothetical protein